jgi:CelD/BcsL family acetyltransferase involved in cellulose biosynthesis
MTVEPSRILVEIARDDAELARHVEDWEALARDAVEPNVFFETGPLRAALRHMPLPGPFCGLFLYREAPDAPRARRLIAFVPFVRTAKGPSGILRSYQLFTFLHCYLSTPLVHREHLDEAIDALLAWMDGAPDGVRIFGLYGIAGDGPLVSRLSARLLARRQPHLVERSHERAFLRVGPNARRYLEAALPAKKRKELRRQRRRLEEEGEVTVAELRGDEEARTWMERFLALEAKGWKGSGGHAFDRTAEGRRFFLEFLEHFVARGRAMLLALRLDGNDIAMKCNLLAPDAAGSFAFKIAHDEMYARFSPGVLLELDNVERLHDPRRGIAWMDSCADPGHPMIERVWSERRRITYVMCCARGPVGRTLLALFRWRNRRLRANRGPR